MLIVVFGLWDMHVFVALQRDLPLGMFKDIFDDFRHHHPDSAPLGLQIEVAIGTDF
jgi:hypothetical protein